MLYEIRFDDKVPREVLRRILQERFGITPTSVQVNEPDDHSVACERPVVIVTPPEDDEHFGWILTGGTELAQASRMSELELARVLSTALGLQALVDDGTQHPDRWVMVARDGTHGRVITDEDAAAEGDLRVEYALEPIPGAPHLRVIPEARW